MSVSLSPSVRSLNRSPSQHGTIAHRPSLTAAPQALIKRTAARTLLCRVSSKPHAWTSSAPGKAVELSPDEQRSLQAILASTGLQNSLQDGASTPRLTPQQLPDDISQQLLQTIQQGVEKEVQDLQQLEGAMLLAEQLHYASQSGPQAPGESAWKAGSPQLTSTASPQAVEVWQPIFASSGGFPRLLYIPVPEYFDMHRSLPDAMAISISSGGSIDISSSTPTPDDGTVNIVTELGPFTTHFLGSCRWLNGEEFEYCINKIRIDFGGRSFTLPMPMKLQNVLSFFLVTPELACARSKLGGTMLLQANPAKGKRYLDAW